MALLVHGFNNDECQAKTSYHALLDRLRGRGIDAILDQVWEFYWPGYVESRLPPVRPVQEQGTDSALTSFLTYSLQVPKAVRAGDALAEFLVKLNGPDGQPTEFIFIAHSLGCRVVLQTVRALAQAGIAGANRIPAICLMAAAVPTYMVEYLSQYWWAAHYPTQSFVLYSRKDFVLKAFFPPGQTFAREGHWPEAVGRWGQPAQVWTARDETMLGHTEYYASPVTTSHLLRLFGVATAKNLPEFHPLPWTP